MYPCSLRQLNTKSDAKYDETLRSDAGIRFYLIVSERTEKAFATTSDKERCLMRMQLHLKMRNIYRKHSEIISNLEVPITSKGLKIFL